MVVLNLRKIPRDLVRRLKADPALSGKTLREHCVGLLSQDGGRGGTRQVQGRVGETGEERIAEALQREGSNPAARGCP